MLPPKFKEAHTKHRSSLLVAGEARCNNLPFILEWISWYAPHHWIPRNFTEVEDSQIVRFISHPLPCTYLTNKSRVVATSCSLRL